MGISLCFSGVHLSILLVFLFLISRDLVQQFAEQLALLHLGQLSQFVQSLGVVPQIALLYNLACLPVSLCLRDFVVLIPHVHVPGSIRGVFLPAVIEAWEVLLELFSTSPDVFLPHVLFQWQGLLLSLHALNQRVDEVLLLLVLLREGLADGGLLILPRGFVGCIILVPLGHRTRHGRFDNIILSLLFGLLIRFV